MTSEAREQTGGGAGVAWARTSAAQLVGLLRHGDGGTCEWDGVRDSLAAQVGIGI